MGLMAVAVCGCASLEKDKEGEVGAANGNVYVPKTPIFTQPSPGRAGDMAYVVERLAKADGCELSDNANLMAKRPGIQFYRVECADGRQILYRCEMRQCKTAE